MQRYLLVLSIIISSLCSANADTLDISTSVFFSSVFNLNTIVSDSLILQDKLIFTNNSNIVNGFFLRTKSADHLLQGTKNLNVLFQKKGYKFYQFKLASKETIEIKLIYLDPYNTELYYLDESATENTVYLMQESKGGANYYLSFFGISLFFFMAFIHFFNYLVINKKEYLYYSIYLFLVSFYFYLKYFLSYSLCFFSDCDNHLELYIGAWTQQLFHCIYVQFVRHFLDTRSKYPLYDRVAKGYIVFTLFSIAILIILSMVSLSYFIAYFHLYRIIALLISFWMIYYIARRWDKINIFIVIGTSLLVMFAIASMYYSILGYYPMGIFPISFMLVGVLLEVLFFSAALTYKSHLSNKHKLQIERDLNLEKTRSEELLRVQQLKIETALKETKAALEIEKQEQIKSALEIKEKENEMEVLLLQMNPHFIFNTMNSLKTFVLLDKKEKAVDHLEKMADFIRGVLNQSRTKRISLKQELESIRLYFDLEIERLKDKIELEIRHHKLEGIEELLIPPMLLQPIIENAIWHGLAPSSQRNKKIIINIKERKDQVFISIRDNGIGRQASQKNDQKQHKSLGTSITNKRISLHNNGKNGLFIIDHKNNDGTAAGTEIIIKIYI